MSASVRPVDPAARRAAVSAMPST